METISPEVQEQLVRILDKLEIYLNYASKFDWISLLSIIASFTISCVAICISIRTARRQNKISLFEKRFYVYNEVYNMIVFIASGAKPNIHDVDRFGQNVHSMEMLFDSEIQIYIKRIFVNAIYLFELNDSDVKNLPGKEDREKFLVSKNQEDIVNWFKEQLNVYYKVFDKYLNLRKIG